MITLRFTSKVGSASSLAAAHTASKKNEVVVAFSVSGPDSHSVIAQIKIKIEHAELDSPTSFLSLLERIQELWTPLYGELAAVFTFEQKIYLLALNGEIWLRRAEKFGRVLKSSEELKVVEGRVQDKDQYFVLTQSASVALTELFGQVASGAHSFEHLNTYLQSKIDSSGLADRSALAIVEVENPPDDAPMLAESASALPGENSAIGTGATSLPVASSPSKSTRQFRIQPIIAAATRGAKKAAMLAKALAIKIPPALKQLRELRNQRLSPQQRKKAAIILMVACGIGVLLVGFLIFRSVQIRRGQTFLIPFEQRLTSLAVLANTDTVAARDQVIVLQKEFETQKTTLNGNLFAKKKLNDFSTQLASFVKDVSGKVELQTLPIFYDFRLVQADFIASRADIDQNRAVFLDQEKQSAVSLVLDSKQQTLLPIGQYPTLKDMAFAQEKLYLLADGVYTFPIDAQSSAQKVIDEGDSNRDGKLLRVFGEFVYVFNPEKRNLFRYFLAQEGTQPEPIGWFQDKKDLDFLAVSSFAIDGNVWLGTEQGQVLRYERGNPVAFNIQGLQEPFSSRLKVYTKEELDSVFVLEPAKNRAVRLSKDGVFIKQIQSPSLGAATDIIFSPVTNKAYALAGSLVYELAL